MQKKLVRSFFLCYNIAMQETTIRANALADLLFSAKPCALDTARRAAWDQLVREMGLTLFPELTASDIKGESDFFLRALIAQK